MSVIDAMHTTVVDFQTARLKQTDRFRQCITFCGKDASCERIRGIRVLNGDDTLQDDWAVIVFVIHKVDCTSADSRSTFQDRFMNMMPMKPMTTEGRDQ